ncbi:hypothetical protein ABE504_20160 [Paenibacillus oryzisoli]|uniref:hypothetical protein n=1 Tax=Paenibacillus oryzisoli TaxID=1850517 RepID=UPI003D28E67F
MKEINLIAHFFDFFVQNMEIGKNPKLLPTRSKALSYDSRASCGPKPANRQEFPRNPPEFQTKPAIRQEFWANRLNSEAIERKNCTFAGILPHRA